MHPSRSSHPETLLRLPALPTLLALLVGLLAPAGLVAQEEDGEAAAYVRSHYSKFEARIPMRDGVELWTAIFVPNDRSQEYPILMHRTPYRVDPYGADGYPEQLGPSMLLANNGYIFVYQDVRGTHMSEGQFVNMRPHREVKDGPEDVDESTDTYDTIEWLLANVPGHNGRVGQWGISYPGFYTAAGAIDSHPALKAVSPQAPIADWFFDDFHHHGAFFLPHTFNFFASFGVPRDGLTTGRFERFDHGTPDGYRWFLDVGPVKNLDTEHLEGEVPFWNELVAHPNYDAFWQSRNILPHLDGITAAVLTVGGWYDAEDLYGPLQIYRSIEENNPDTVNSLVMGPWVHGGWSRTTGEKLGEVHFGFPTSRFYREEIEAPFFEHFLRGEGELEMPEAWAFETGANRWRTFEEWPPEAVEERSLHVGADGRLGFEPPEGAGGEGEAYDEYVSDPAHPVPYTELIDPGMTKEYMVADQRFAARRPDVVAYRSEPLEEDLTLAGPIEADLWVSTSGTASDWVVKVIDVFPGDAGDNPAGQEMGGYQMLVRSEVIRGRFRNSYEHPEPFEPDRPTRVTFELQDLLHTFKRGHRVMVQIQSTWFPLVDRNPQTYVPNIFEAGAEDFVPATQRIYRSPEHPTRLVVGVLPGLGE